MTAPVIESDSELTNEPAPVDRDLRKAAVHGLRWASMGRLAVELMLLTSMVVLARLIPSGRVRPVRRCDRRPGARPGYPVAGARQCDRAARPGRSHPPPDGPGVGPCLWNRARGPDTRCRSTYRATDLRRTDGVSRRPERAAVHRCWAQHRAHVDSPARAGLPGSCGHRRLQQPRTRGGVNRPRGCRGWAPSRWSWERWQPHLWAPLLAWAIAPPPFPRLNVTAARNLMRYGGPASLASVSWVCFRNCDYAIVGARVGTTPAGLVLPRLSTRGGVPGRRSLT